MKKSVLFMLFILLTLSLFGTSIGWGNMQWPNSISIVQGETTESIYGQVWMEGVTDSPGQGAGITAELGYGSDGSTPDATWTWFIATYSGDVGSNDEYYYNLLCSMAAGEYDYTYRYHYETDPVDDYYYAGNVGNLTVSAAPPPTYNITFQVDMEHQTVDPAGVYISGSFNGWGTTAMTPPVRSNIYTVTLVLESAYYEYKYVNGAEYETIANRTITTPESDHIVPTVFFNDFAGGTTQTVDVTFSVNMGLLDPGWYVGGVSVQGSVAPLDWVAGSNLLTDPDEDLVYTGTITFPAGSAYDVEYKFTREDGTRAWNWESVANRPFTIDDSGSNQTIEMNYWDDDEPVPVNLSSFYALYIGGTPTIYWITETETNNDYWNVYRGNNNNFIEALHLNANAHVPGNGTTNNVSEYVYVDTAPVVQNTTYWYWIEDVSLDGETEVHESITLFIPYEDIENAPAIYGLHQNYPNPFNPSTSISFTLEEESNVELTIYNVKGAEIKTIFNDHIDANQVRTVIWDGNDATGKQVSSGIYYYKMKTDNHEETRKMILMK